MSEGEEEEETVSKGNHVDGCGVLVYITSI